MYLSTSFNVIFEQFLLIVDDPKFINSYAEDTLALELSRYLYRSIGICGDYLYKDISIYKKTKIDENNNVIIGDFEENLNEQEISFLARGMTIPYLEFQLQKQRHLNQIVYGKDYGIHSQAQHIKEVRETIVEMKKELKQDMIMYSLHQDPNKLQSSGGG